MLDKVSTCGNLLHIVSHWEDWGGYSVTENTQSPKMCLNFNFRGGGWNSVTENTQSPKICLNFNFWGWGVGGYSVTENKILKVPRCA